MRTEVIKADTIHEAAERILLELKEEDTSTTARSISGRDNVIYFDGWDGLGATAVLRAVAQRLAGAVPAGLQFDQIIHINCSKWESRRAMQRAIAEELKLPAEVMEMLDRQDEEDDYNGEEQGFRTELPQVVREIYQNIENRRFLIIFYNGSGEEIDLTSFGFPLQDLGFHLYSRNKVLWTFQGAFRLKSRTKIDETMKRRTMTGVFLSAVAAASVDDEDVHWSDFVRQEAAELAARKDTGFMDLQPAQVTACFLYILNLCGTGRHFSVDYDLASHGSNYMVCDGMIQPHHELDDDRSWRVADALQHEMRLDMDYYHQYLPPHLVKCAGTMPCWTSPTYRIVQMLDGGNPNTGDIFRRYDNLGVLRLSRCTFSFSSPPFLCCHNLRFLWLDHCKDCSKQDDEAAWKEEDNSSLRTLVLHRYTQTSLSP